MWGHGFSKHPHRGRSAPIQSVQTGAIQHSFQQKRVKADATGGDLRFGWAKIFLKMRVKVLGECVKIVLRRVKCVNSALERIEILRTMLCRKIAFSTKIKDHSTKHCQKWLQNAIFYVKNEPEMHMVTKK